MASQNDQDWQLTKKTVLERNQLMFNNSLMSDIQFTGGESGQKFYAHKYVLATSSPVFFTMFYGSLPETKSEICLSDTNDEAFEEFLRFIYTDNCQLTIDRAFKVMYLSKKYMLPPLTEKCIEEIKKGLKAENVATVLQEALHFDERDLAEQCWELIQLDTGNVIISESFNEISQETLTSLLKRESLNISEVEIFQAVIQWSDHQCSKIGLEPTGENRRSVLGDVVYQICFLSMTQQEFAQHVGKSKILSFEEMVAIYARFNKCDTPVLTWEPPSKKRRSIKVDRRQIRFPRCTNPQQRIHPQQHARGVMNSRDLLCFSVDKLAYFHGVRLFSDYHASIISFEVFFEVNGIKISGNNYQTETSRSNNAGGVRGFDVILSNPLLIEENETVTMSVSVNGPMMYYQSFEQKTSVNVEGLTVTFSNSSIEGGRISSGQFYEIILSV